MKPFDLNIHLPDQLHEETMMDQSAILKSFFEHFPAIEKQCDGGNFMIFNSALPLPDLENLMETIRTHIPAARFTLLAPLGNPEGATLIRQWKALGVDAIKFHSYVQEIEAKDFPEALLLAQVARDLKMPLFIDTSYGTARMYRCDNLRLAAFVLESITDTPVVLLHSGGARILEALVLAGCPNVVLESSFTMDYYQGSTVEQDLAFAYKKLEPGRVAFGSDFPYVSFEDSHKNMKRFLKNHDFDEEAREAMFKTTGSALFG